ncbi:S8 family peptidase [Natronolimnohabitans sp. A-GB9]|uniref:S8 family peptidase n=1 Tax=Natronolimnohabitans sp. A-GB9 TaxID=3069757 RepID=UPI0027B3BF1C|nr:S8 family peptidase [Natronolimnohabitans sp. A-GB9]MDQ2050201.1 S8 family peptidase [Natronolimnohabitans sp. A-GB9]
MTLSRRQLLRGVGAGTAAGLVGVSTSAAASTTETRRVFVHPRNGLVGNLLDAVEAVGGTTVLEYESFDFVVAEVPTDRLDELRALSPIASVEDDENTGIPDDWSPSLLDLLRPPGEDCSTHPDQESSWGHDRIGVGDVDPTGADVDIGILDTGIQTDHCSLEVAGGRNVTSSGPPGDYEDRHGHGTHVAGVAAGADNDLGVVGAAPDANLYAVKVLDDEGNGWYSELIAGIDWCIEHDVELISMSLGGTDSHPAVDEAIETAHAAGHLLLSAAGNQGNNGADTCDEETMTYPATHEDVVAVAAMNEDDTLASYSSVGSAIDLLAPGTDVNSTYANNEYAEASGTSIACPFVTGVAALVWETRAEDGPGPNEAVRGILADTAEPVLESCAEGHGIVDARAAVGDDRSTDGGDDDTGLTGGLTDGGAIGSVVEWVTDLIAGIVDWIRGLFS